MCLLFSFFQEYQPNFVAAGKAVLDVEYFQFDLAFCDDVTESGLDVIIKVRAVVIVVVAFAFAVVVVVVVVVAIGDVDDDDVGGGDDSSGGGGGDVGGVFVFFGGRTCLLLASPTDHGSEPAGEAFSTA